LIYRSPYPDVEIPGLTLPELILGRARERGDHPALIDAETGGMMTYAQLAEAVDRLAARLHEDGFAKGEVAALCTPNRVDFPVAAYAVARLGGIVTTLNPAFTAEETRRQLDDSGAVIAFTTHELAPRSRPAPGRRQRSRSTRPRTWSPCPTPAAPPGCPRA